MAQRTLSGAILAWANRLFDRTTGGARRPVFFDIDSVRPELRVLDRNFTTIRSEVLQLLERRHEIPRYHEVDVAQYRISAQTDSDRDWKVFYLHAMGVEPRGTRDSCPATAALLDGIPGLFQAFFSILDPRKSIPPHCGPYRGYIRYHLGLIVPEKSPPAIRVHDQWYTWAEGKSVLFDDSWEHEVLNVSPGERVVLIVDIRRPMPLPYAAVNRALELGMRLLYGRKLMQRILA